MAEPIRQRRFQLVPTSSATDERSSRNHAHAVAAAIGDRYRKQYSNDDDAPADIRASAFRARKEQQV
ncbi:hypothetical protein HG717_33325 [Rhodococcus erythropolis]|uniref:hypothetical protein n=1 Tax=Rhodococcus erythropolis TaxID=1833 RepID=UPI001C9A9837|nr:hypothetical protein [Rhodococcus erythropolis]MBY6388758.1 hypothetical protein [Rhodococcus erythropolis]